MAKRDIYQEVTNKIIEALEAGTVPWDKPWDAGEPALTIPTRSTGEFYQGINILLLWMTQSVRGYMSNRWFTYKQASTLGGQVRKGEKSTEVIYYSTYAKEDDQGEEKQIRFLKSYRVFNADQIDNLPEQYYTKPNPPKDFGNTRDAGLDAFFASTGAIVQERGNSAFYQPSTDKITMPPFATFKTTEAFYFVLAHETVHWTGSKARLDRPLGKAGSAKYAFEELVAELGAVFTMSRLEARPVIERSAQYIEGWLSALRNDKKFIFKAASDASKATEFLFEQSQQNQEEAA